MREPIKTQFCWDDIEDENTFSPCDYCKAIEEFPVCDDGVTSSACNHCHYNIVQYLFTPSGMVRGVINDESKRTYR